MEDLSHWLFGVWMVLISEDYFQERSTVYPKLNVDEAFRKALTTWGRWVDKYVNPKKSLVFFRGFSLSHFRYVQFFHGSLKILFKKINKWVWSGCMQWWAMECGRGVR